MYATCQEMTLAFGEDEVIALTDRTGEGRVDETIATAALVRASDEADSYLAGRYAVPVSPVPPVLIAMVCDMARYRLTGGAAQETDPITERYRLAIQWLTRVADGNADLPGVGAPASGGGAVQFSAGRRVWQRTRGKDA
jgi:phage gp36-like protein